MSTQSSVSEMSNHGVKAIQSNERSNTAAILKTGLNNDIISLHHPPKLSVKRRISHTLRETFNRFPKRRRTSDGYISHRLSYPCRSIPKYHTTESDLQSERQVLQPSPRSSSSNKNLSVEGTSTTTSAFHQLLIKIHQQLRVLKKYHKTKATTIHFRDSQHPSILHTPCGLHNLPDTHSGCCPLAYNGMANLPNVSQFLDAHGEAGRSDYYNTTDWDKFQASLETCNDPGRRSDGLANLMISRMDPAITTPEIYYTTDVEAGAWHRRREPSPWPEELRRRSHNDSIFVRWLRRSSKGKGKQRRSSEDWVPQLVQSYSPPMPPTNTPDSTLYPLTKIRPTTPEPPVLDPSHISQTCSSSPRPSVPSVRFLEEDVAPAQGFILPPSTWLSGRLSPLRGRPSIRSYMLAEVSTTEFAASRGMQCPPMYAQTALPLSPNYILTPQDSSVGIGTKDRSLPIDILYPTEHRRSSVVTKVTAEPTRQIFLQAASGIEVSDSRSDSPSNSINLDEFDDHPIDSTLPPSSFSPTETPVSAMSNLILASASCPGMVCSGSSELVFQKSLEQPSQSISSPHLDSPNSISTTPPSPPSPMLRVLRRKRGSSDLADDMRSFSR